MSKDYTVTITRLLAELKSGDKEAKDQAIGKLWEAYFDRLCAVANTKLTDKAKRVNDASDVLVSVFSTLRRRVAAGKWFADIDRDGFWRLLVTITRFKAIDRNRREMRRGGADSPEYLTEEIVSHEPTPEDVEVIKELIDGLMEPDLIRIATMKMAGSSNAEIAVALQVSTRTIERKIKVIKNKWGVEFDT